MKYLLLLGFVLAVVWLWRSSRRSPLAKTQPQPAPMQPAAQRGVTEIVACNVCQVHLPRSDALIGRDGEGTYCCAAHRDQAAN